MKCSYGTILSICLFAPFAQQASADGVISQAPGENAFAYTLTSHLGESGWAIKRSAHYEYGPAVVQIRGSENTLHMWFCGGGGSGRSGGDSIWYSRSDNYGQWGSWTTPAEVIRPSNRTDYLDHAHACDPSVTEYGGYYYVMYTGAPNWTVLTKYRNYCQPSGGPMGCDNRIFAARVPAAQLGTPAAYQKLVNVGECAAASCFQWRGAADDTYPPVPIIRYETGPVWRIEGSGSTGYTSPQTPMYGIGQPSQVSVLSLRVWFSAVSQNFAGVRVWNRNAADIANPYLLQDVASYAKATSNVANDINYEIAFDSSRNRYVNTASREDANGRPCVHMAHVAGPVPATGSTHVISNNFMDQPSCFFTQSELQAHNAGFVRDQWGYLALSRGHSRGPAYYWVYYGTNRLSLCGAECGKVDINRVPFTLSP